MGCYGFCVLPRGAEPPEGLIGLDAQAVVARNVGDLTVWVSEIARPEPALEQVQAHNRVVEAAITDEVTPVPLRFGQWSEDAGAFDALIAAREDWYRERLRTFAGALEFGIRVLRPDKPSPARLVRVAAAKTGTAYMDALRASMATARGEREEAERVRAGIAEFLRDFVREEHVEEPRTPHGVVTVSHLVAREDFDRYRERVHELRDRSPELRFLLSGPWVPYSFAT
jgi:hypothetical protein